MGEDDFSVKVDGDEVKVTDRDYFHKVEYLWKIGEPPEDYKDYCNEEKLRGISELEGETEGGHKIYGWIGSEYGEEAPIQSPFDYYIVVLEDCKIRTDDGEEIERLEVALRTINSVGEDDGKKAARETEFFDELNHARKRLRNAKEILERERDSK